MPDTQRPLSSLQTLFADNSTGDISPQDLRDFLVSALGGYGHLYCAEGSISQTASVLASKLTAWNNNGASSQTTPDHANDQITVGVGAVYLVMMSASLRADAGRTVKLQVYKNSVEQTGISAEHNAQSSNDITTLSVSGVVTCSANDVISVYVSSSVDFVTVTVSEASLTVKRVS